LKAFYTYIKLLFCKNNNINQIPLLINNIINKLEINKMQPAIKAIYTTSLSAAGSALYEDI